MIFDAYNPLIEFAIPHIGMIGGASDQRIQFSSARCNEPAVDSILPTRRFRVFMIFIILQYSEFSTSAASSSFTQVGIPAAVARRISQRSYGAGQSEHAA